MWCSWAVAKALHFLVLFFEAWQLYVMFNQLLQKWGQGWIVFTLFSVPCSKACDRVAVQPGHLTDSTENKPVLKPLIFCETLSWLLLLCCCVIAGFDARERKGKWLEGWEATGFGAGLQLAWDGMRSCTLIVHVPAYVVITINSSGIYFTGQSWCRLRVVGVPMYCKIYLSKYHMWY